MTTQDKIRKIIQEVVLEHGLIERRRECDCLACRKGGKIDQALTALTKIIEEKEEK